MKIKIITNTFGKHHRQDVAVDSWLHIKKLYPDVIDVEDHQFEDELFSFKNNYDLPTKFKLHRSSLDVINSKKKLPFIFDILKVGVENIGNDDYVIYTNNDCIIQPSLIDFLIHDTPNAWFSSRLDIADISSFDDVKNKKVTPIRYETFGQDVFVFRKKWFIDNIHFFASDYLVGAWRWDNVFASLIKILNPKNENMGVYFPPYVFHIHHGLSSVSTESAEKTWNQNVMENNTIHHLAFKVFDYYLKTFMVKRRDFPRLMMEYQNEKQEEIEYFQRFKIANL